MKKIYFLLAGFIFANFISVFTGAVRVNAQSPNWTWAKSEGGINSDEAHAVAVDAAGNSYVAGRFESPTLAFGPTVLTLTNSNGFDSSDIFLAKYDPNGNVLWAKSAIGTSMDDATSVVVDAAGNSYVAGYFDSPTLNFGSIVLTNAGTRDIFLAKYDANGNVIWAKSAGGTNDDGAYSIAVDAAGNSYVAGYFDSPTLSFGSTALTNAGLWDIFIAKYDANGNILWAKAVGGTKYDWVYSIAADASGNSYVTGVFQSTSITFGTTVLTNTAYNAIFLAKYDANGNVLWAKSAGGGAYTDDATSVAVDALGNSYVTGYFGNSSITFGSFILTNANVGYRDMFIVKYDALGNVLWAKSVGGTGLDFATSVTVDASGNSYVTGGFQSTSITFGATVLTKIGSDDIFLAKYDANGNALWAKSVVGGVVGSDYALATSVAIDASGNSYITGHFGSANTSLSITFGSITLSSVGYADIFLAKSSSGVTGVQQASFTAFDIIVYPTVSSGVFRLSMPFPFREAVVEVYSVIGEKIYEAPTQGGETQLSLHSLGQGQIIDLSFQPDGIYFLTVKTEKGISTQKVIIQK